MLLKIYFDNKPLFLVNALNPELESYLGKKDTAFTADLSPSGIDDMLHRVQSAGISRGIFLHKDVNAVLEAVKQRLTLILAAGGVVYNNERELLLIFRRGKWDLPKGKLDEDEELEACALREIKEETGLLQMRSEGPLTVTYHTYQQFGQHILKESHWYLVKAVKQAEFTPQLDEDIEKCEWVKIENLAPYMENTHASILDVIHMGIKSLHQERNV